MASAARKHHLKDNPCSLDKQPLPQTSIYAVGDAQDDRNVFAVDDHEKPEVRVSDIRQRFRHFTWAWFTLTMSTGGLALLLSVTPHRFPHLTTIGTVIYIFDICLFVLLCIGMVVRFAKYPGTLKHSLSHPSESLFFPTFFLSLPSIIGGFQIYGNPPTIAGPWLTVAIRVCFWIYVGCTYLVACLQYWFLFTGELLTVQSMTPAWVLPIFPVMLSGTLAGIVAPHQPPKYAMQIIVAGLTFQGLGIMVSVFMYSIYLGRLMQYGLPAPKARAGMFISVGPPAFTSLALITMANALPKDYGYFARVPSAYETLNVMALFVAIFLWATSFWFFSITLISVLVRIGKMKFHLTWWAYVFPNTGFAIATIDIGAKLESNAILWVGSVMTVILVGLWLFVLGMHVYAVWTAQIMYPGKDEDA